MTRTDPIPSPLPPSMLVAVVALVLLATGRIGCGYASDDARAGAGAEHARADEVAP